MNPSGPVDGDVTASSGLHPYRAILVVDTEAFSSRRSAQQSRLSALIEQVLEAAFKRAGMETAWRDRRFAPSPTRLMSVG